MRNGKTYNYNVLLIIISPQRAQSNDSNALISADYGRRYALQFSNHSYLNFKDLCPIYVTHTLIQEHRHNNTCSVDVGLAGDTNQIYLNANNYYNNNITSIQYN